MAVDLKKSEGGEVVVKHSVGQVPRGGLRPEGEGVPGCCLQVRRLRLLHLGRRRMMRMRMPEFKQEHVYKMRMPELKISLQTNMFQNS